MRDTFKSKDEHDPFSCRNVLSVKQIKQWFSSEAARRKKAVAQKVVEGGMADLLQAADAQENSHSSDESRAGEGGCKGGGGGDSTLLSDGEEGGREGEDVEGRGGGEGGTRSEGGGWILGGVSEGDGGNGSEEGGGVLGGVSGGEASFDGSFWVVINEQWRDRNGFVLYELERGFQEESMDVGLLGESLMGRMLVHELPLVCTGQQKVPAQNLMDKGSGFVQRLAAPGARTFAPRLGKPGEMKAVVPIDEGDFWYQIRGVHVTEYVDSNKKIRFPSFVFENECDVVRTAYAKLQEQEDE
jgi:hypothetical protein